MTSPIDPVSMLAAAGKRIIELEAERDELKRQLEELKHLPYMAWGVKSGLTGRIYWHTTEEGARRQLAMKAPHGTTLVRKAEIIEEVDET